MFQYVTVRQVKKKKKEVTWSCPTSQKKKEVSDKSKKKKEVRQVEEEGGYMVRTRNYVANDDQKNRAVRNAGHHP
jgi:hypothetical protein